MYIDFTFQIGFRAELITLFIVVETGPPENPPYKQVNMLKYDEGRRQARLSVVLHHQEIHLVLPHLHGICLNFFKNMPENKNYTSHRMYKNKTRNKSFAKSYQ